MSTTIFDTLDFEKALNTTAFEASFILLHGKDDFKNLLSFPKDKYEHLYNVWKKCVMQGIFDKFIASLDTPNTPVLAKLEVSLPLLIANDFDNIKECFKSIFDASNRFAVAINDESNKIYIYYCFGHNRAILTIDNASFYNLRPFELDSVQFTK